MRLHKESDEKRFKSSYFGDDFRQSSTLNQCLLSELVQLDVIALVRFSY
jgi:hypothetical protein